MMRSPVKVHIRKTDFSDWPGGRRSLARPSTIIVQAKYSHVQHCYHSMWLHATLCVAMGAQAYGMR